MNSSPALVSCPGKLLLCGEYAVLHGAPAVVAAVDRRASARPLRRMTHSLSPVLEAVQREVLRFGLEERGESWVLPPLSVDTSAFRRRGRKLGLGSSAAAAVAACGAWLAMCGIRVEQHLTTVARLAHQGHRAAQGGRGSGVDIAASVYGGVLRFRPDEPVFPLPALGFEMAVVDTGTSASTSLLLSAVEELRRHAADIHAMHMRGLRDVALGFVAALEDRDIGAALRLADDYGLRMAALGESAGCPIVTPALRLLGEMARDLGGAAKPSGAGGGDLAVAFFSDRTALERFLRDCRRRSLSSVRLRIGAAGLREETATAVNRL